MTDQSQFKLIIEDDEGRRSVVPVDVGDVSIGRLEGNTIRLKERNVSRRHARLSRSDDGNVFCEDLDSYNGLWVNGDRVSGKRPLHEGDLLRIGDFQLELRGAGLLKRNPDENTQKTTLGPDTQPGFQHEDLATTADAVQLLQPPPVRPNGGPPPIKAFSSEPTLTDVDSPPEMEPMEEQEPTGLIRGGTDPDLQNRGNNVLPAPHAKLVCVSTQFAGKEFELMFAENVIGRTDDNQIGIDHRSVSRQHAKIVVASRRFRIVDMGSANGTLVNGEVYAQTELKRGDLIELGHVKLRFVPPGEHYELTEEEQAEITGKGRMLYALRKNLSVVVALLVIVVMAALIATYVVLSGSSDKNASLAMPPPPTNGSTINDESARLLAQAHLAQGQKQWKRAQSMASAALELDPANEDAKVLAHNADAEMKSQHSFETAQQAAQSKAWSDAFNALQEVPKESCYYAQGQQLLDQVKPQLASERVGDARTALKNEDFDDAELLVEELQDLDPQRHEIAELKQAIDDGRKKKGIKAGPHPAHTKAPLQQKVKAVPAPLSSHEPPPEDAKILYADGTKALNGGLFAKAIELFGRCMMADKNFSMCYRAMGIAYAKSGNGPKAVRYYRLYLKVEPNARDAPQVKAMLQQYDTAAGGAPSGQ